MKKEIKLKNNIADIRNISMIRKKLIISVILLIIR